MIVEIVVLDSKENCETEFKNIANYLIILIHNDQYDYK